MNTDFKSIPGRVFLDTNLVNFILDNGEHIHDGVPCPPEYSSRVVEDIEALYNIFLTGQRASWQLAISPYTYHEVIKTNDKSRKYQLEKWFFEIWHYWLEIVQQDNYLPHFLEAEDMRVQLLSSTLLDALPDFSDKVLLIDSIVYRCDVFCTRDWRTILSVRAELKDLPIKIATPCEWWEMIKPYARLWV